MKPIIALTMGDPAGIGPELVAQVLTDQSVYDRCRPLVIGDAVVFADITRRLGMALTFREIADPAEATFSPGRIDLLRPPDLNLPPVTLGALDPVNGEAVAACLRAAFELASVGQIHGIVAAPMNKEAFHRAGYHYRDELAFFAELTGASDAFLMGVMGPVWTTAVTEHIPFKDIVGYLTQARVCWYTEQMQRVLTQVGIEEPNIAVAALNPHAGEGGLFGTEEIEILAPAVKQARAAGLRVQGPVPADMVFVRALAGDFDGVVCMYHDQANIARKLQPKETGATLYMGLPVACTTTAHGTAFDIAGQGIADPGSLKAALRYAIRLGGGGG